MQAEDDGRAQVAGRRPHGGRPRLEQLRRGALDDRVAGEPAPCGIERRVRPDGGCGEEPPGGDEPASEGPQVQPLHAGGIRAVEVRHGDGVRPDEARERLTGGTAALSVHRGEHRHLGRRSVDAEACGDRGVEVVGARRGGEHRVAGHDGEHARLDLAEVGADEDVPRLRGHGRPQGSGEVVQPVLGGHPPGGSVARRPPAAEPVVGTDRRVEPPVAVRRRDALGLAPAKQGVDDRVRAPVGSEDALARRRDLDPHRREHGPHLGRVAQVRALASRDVAEDVAVPLPTGVGRVGLARRATPRGPGDDPLGGMPVDREAVALELDAQHRRRRLRVARPDHERAEGRGPLTLSGRAGRGRLGPGEEPAGGAEPLPVDRIGAQMPVGADERLVRRRRAGLGREGEEVATPGSGDGLERDPVRRGPGHPGSGSPAAGEQPVDLGDVPAARDAHAREDERSRVLLRLPPHPAGATLALQPLDECDRLGDRTGISHPVAGQGAPARSAAGARPDDDGEQLLRGCAGALRTRCLRVAACHGRSLGRLALAG